MTERYMKASDVRKLVDIMWECVCLPWYPEYRERFAEMSIEELAQWVRYQMKNQFPAQAVGSNYISLKPENFETIRPPQHMIDMLNAYKALSEDYRFGLSMIANEGYTSDAAATVAELYLGKESADSRAAIEVARQARERA